MLLETVNQTLFAWINATEQSPQWLISVAVFAARDLIFIVPVCGAAMWLWGTSDSIHRQREALLRTCMAIVIALIISWLLGAAYYHPRPFMNGAGHQFLHHSPDTSWPSDHGTVIYTFALALNYWYRRWAGTVFFVTGVIIAWSRIYLGVHWPFDMLCAGRKSMASYRWPAFARFAGAVPAFFCCSAQERLGAKIGLRTGDSCPYRHADIMLVR